MAARIDSLKIIDVAAPCDADWDAMTGDERVRRCQLCQMNVYNLSEMTEAEALELVNQREGRLCIQFYRRADGTMLTKDCPIGLKAIRKAIRQKIARMWASMAALAGAILVGGIFGRSAGAEKLSEPAIPDVDPRLIEVVKGKICVTQPPSPVALLSYETLKTAPADTIKNYLGRCLEKEEQASYGMPDPDNMNALDESVRQAWRLKVDDASFLPNPGTREHDELSKITAELLKKHPDIALQISGPPAHLIHAVRGQMILRPDVAPVPR